jgi:hypothetical protein
LERYTAARSAPGSVAASRATTRKEERGEITEWWSARIFRTSLFPVKAKFLPENLWLAVDFQHLLAEFVVNRPRANFTSGLVYKSAMRPLKAGNQTQGLISAQIMRSGETKSIRGWLLKELTRIVYQP